MPPIFRRLCLLILSLGSLPGFAIAADSPAEMALAKALGWVSAETGCSTCGGYYDPHIFPKASSVALKDAEVVIDAPPPIRYEINGDAVFKNGVTITQPGRILSAKSAVIRPDLATGKLDSVSADGGVRIAQSGQLLLADSFKADLIDHKAELTEVNYLLKVGVVNPGQLTRTDPNFTGFAHGSAKTVEQVNENEFILSHATYSTCAPLTRTWELSANKIELDPATGRGQAYQSTLKIHGVPLLYLPYFDFPINNERKSGFLYGTVVPYSSASGFSMGVPYYFNLAPNYDDTFTPTLFTKRGILFNNNFRYLTQKSSGNIELQGIPDDQADNQANRYSYSVNDTTNLSRNWQTNLNYNYVSDDSYLTDFSTQNLFGANQVLLNRSFSTQYQSLHWNFNGLLQSYQIVNDELTTTNRPYSELPSLVLTGQYPDAYGPFSFATATSFVNFTKQSAVTNEVEPVQGQRFNLTPSISLPLTQSFGYVTPSVSLSSTLYNLQNNEVNGFPDNAPSAVLPILSVDSSAYLDRAFSVGQAGGWSQTIQPRVFYLFVPNVNQNNIPVFDTTINTFSYAQLFNTNRFSGLDRLGDANQLSYALSTEINNPLGQQVLSAGVGQIVYFRDRDVSLCHNDGNGPPCIQTENPNYTQRFSDIAAYATYNFNQKISVTANTTYNSVNNVVDSNDYTFSYAPPNSMTLFNVGYQSNRQNYSLLSTQQILAGTSPPISSVVSTSFLWGFTPSWALLGSFNYSLENEGTVSELGGVQYSACCYAVRLLFYQYVVNNNPNTPNVLTGQMDRVIMVQFLLKGLGGVSTSGGQIQSLLAGIPGYNGQLGF